MIKNFLKKIINRIISKFDWKLIKLRKVPEPNPYGLVDQNVLNCINNASGILHLGAHRGTEAEVYNWFGKNVIWVEALPEIFDELIDNLYFYKNQKCFLALLTDKDHQITKFNISNYDKACSSIFSFTEEIKKSQIWNDRSHKMIKSIKLKSITLDTLLKNENISSKDYDHWVLDIQGAELLALKGSEESLRNCKSLHIEVSKKQFYDNGNLWLEIKEWLNERGFQNYNEPRMDEEDILFVRST
jgi:FkbM family methyltransferase